MAQAGRDRSNSLQGETEEPLDDLSDFVVLDSTASKYPVGEQSGCEIFDSLSVA